MNDALQLTNNPPMITQAQVADALMTSYGSTDTYDDALYQAITTYLTSDGTKKAQMLEQIQTKLTQMRDDKDIDTAQWATSYNTFMTIIDPHWDTLEGEIAETFSQ